MTKTRWKVRVGVEAEKDFVRHGVSFEMARDVFQDIFAIEWIDDRHGDME